MELKKYLVLSPELMIIDTLNIDSFICDCFDKSIRKNHHYNLEECW